MFGEKRPGKVNQIRYDTVLPIGPGGCKFKAVAGRFLLCGGGCFRLFNSTVAGRIRVILGVRAVGNNKNLHILIQSAASPKAVPMVAAYLMERLFQRNAPLF